MLTFNICVLVAIPVLLAAAWWHDFYEWNNGVCRISGRKWVYFDTDSQGGRGYKDGDGNMTWISWPLVDRKVRS